MRQILAVGDDNATRRRRRADGSRRRAQVDLGKHVDRVIRAALDHPPLGAASSARGHRPACDGPSRLVLITCAGQFDAGRGGYQDNLIVIATPAGGLKPIGR